MADGREGRTVRLARRTGPVLLLVLGVAAALAVRTPGSVHSPPAVPAVSSPTTAGVAEPVEATPAPAPPTTTLGRRGDRAPVQAAPSAGEEDAPGEDAAPPPLSARLRAALDRWLAGQSGARSVAAGLSFTGNGGLSWTGEAHAGEPLFHAADEYGVLSITKTFTEALVLREVAAGRIDLDAPMPPIAGLEVDADSALTPRMLLEHTSGLVNYPKAVGYDASRPITPREIVSLALHSPRLAPPGREARYSNTNFHWLGLLLEQVTGRSYGDLVAGLAAELGLTHTRLDPTGRPGWFGYASGGVRSTVDDVANWGAALFTPGRVLPAEQLAGLTTVGKAGVTLGLWPLCPCTTGADGTRHLVALRQAVAHGGFFLFPERNLVVVVHYEPAGTAAAETVATALADAVDDHGGDRPTG